MDLSFEFCSILDDFNANETNPVIYWKFHSER